MTLEVKPVLPRFFFDLLGRSIILLCNLIPRTLYIAYVTSGTAQKYCDVADVFKCIIPRLVDCIPLVGRRSDPLSDILQFQFFFQACCWKSWPQQLPKCGRMGRKFWILRHLSCCSASPLGWHLLFCFWDFLPGSSGSEGSLGRYGKIPFLQIWPFKLFQFIIAKSFVRWHINTNYLFSRELEGPCFVSCALAMCAQSGWLPGWSVNCRIGYQSLQTYRKR